jgi:2-polyprenyl-3-methyl-5-hydroxy-6-metoxy-1,4-benzoquinol methylase
MNVTTACPICDSKQVSEAFRSTDYVTSDRFSIQQCGSCSVAFTDPMPGDLGRYYPSTYRDYKPLVLNTLSAFYRIRARQWSQSFPKPGEALEVGCGPGIMLNVLQELGWKVTGLERTEEAAAIGRRLFGVNVLAAEVEDLPPTRQYDLIILFQVLEHMPNPVAIVSECARRLKPGGKIIISVPNFASWQSHFGKAAWLHLDVPRHLFHFSARSLEILLKRAGLSNVSADYVSVEHDPYGWVQTILNKFVRPQNALLRYLMRLDPLTPAAAVSLALGGVLAIPAGIASLASWTVSRGAIISVSASAGSE